MDLGIGILKASILEKCSFLLVNQLCIKRKPFISDTL